MFLVDCGTCRNTNLKLTEEPEILINTNYHNDLLYRSASNHHHRTIIVLVYLVPHALINYDVNVTRKITEVYYFPRYLGN